MTTKEIKETRCMDALKRLSESGEAVFFTFTTPDVVDYHTIRARWCRLRHELLRSLRTQYGKGRKVLYVMNYEKHPGYLQKVVRHPQCGEIVKRSDGNSHGWHIHGVINCFVPLDKFLPLVHSCGFGRTDVRRVTSKGIATYLTKHALKAYAGLSRNEREKYKGQRMRLVNASRGLPTLDEYSYRSPLLTAMEPIKLEERQHEMALIPLPLSRRPDYRKIRQRAEVCALLGFSHVFQLVRLIERLSKEAKEKNSAPASDLAGREGEAEKGAKLLSPLVPGQVFEGLGRLNGISAPSRPLRGGRGVTQNSASPPQPERESECVRDNASDELGESVFASPRANERTCASRFERKSKNSTCARIPPGETP